MGRQASVGLYWIALVLVVVGVDLLFFRNRFWQRLMMNAGIIMVFYRVLFEIPEALMSVVRSVALPSPLSKIGQSWHQAGR
jgi:hypothetical protein